MSSKLLIFGILLSLSCIEDPIQTEYLYKTLVGDFVIKIPKELNFDKQSISYYEHAGNKYPNEFIQTDSKEASNILQVYTEYDQNRNMLEEWVGRGKGVFEDSEMLLRKEINIEPDRDFLFISFIIAGTGGGYDEVEHEKNKSLYSQFFFNYDDVGIYIRINKYQGGKSLREIFKDVALIEKIEVTRVKK